jgi:hypothetical protein
MLYLSLFWILQFVCILSKQLPELFILQSLLKRFEFLRSSTLDKCLNYFLRGNKFLILWFELHCVGLKLILNVVKIILVINMQP